MAGGDGRRQWAASVVTMAATVTDAMVGEGWRRCPGPLPLPESDAHGEGLPCFEYPYLFLFLNMSDEDKIDGCVRTSSMKGCVPGRLCVEQLSQFSSPLHALTLSSPVG